MLELASMMGYHCALSYIQILKLTQYRQTKSEIIMKKKDIMFEKLLQILFVYSSLGLVHTNSRGTPP